MLRNRRLFRAGIAAALKSNPAPVEDRVLGVRGKGAHLGRHVPLDGPIQPLVPLAMNWEPDVNTGLRTIQHRVRIKCHVLMSGNLLLSFQIYKISHGWKLEHIAADLLLCHLRKR